MNILLKISRVFRLAIPGLLFVVIAMAGDDSANGSQEDQASESDEYFQLENCISRSGIRRTEIIDDRTIVFYMSHQKIYLNQLPNRCSGLRSARAFSYRPTGSQLCNVDMITVVRTMGGQPNAGPSCGLGKFRPVTKEEVAMIKNKDTEIPPEEPPQEDDSGEDDSAAE
jgi:Family of unknown function (DUF6491)